MGSGLLLVLIVSGPGRIEHLYRPLAMSQAITSSSVTVTSPLGSPRSALDPPASPAVWASAESVRCALCVVPGTGCTESTGLLAPSRMKRAV
jgi:hypothetical protein